MSRTLQLVLISLLLGVFASFLPASSFAQVATGTPPFGSFAGGPDVINLANLNSHLTVPVLHKPGRGTNFNYDMNYDSAAWYPVGATGSQSWQPVSNWGWRGFGEAEVGYIGQTVLSIPCISGHFPNLIQTGTNSTYGWSYHDYYGVVHGFGTTNQIFGTCGSQSNTSTTLTTTSGGYSFEAIGATEIYLYNSSGEAISAGINSQGIGTGSLADRNGNQISVSGSGVFTDTLGTTALTVAGSGTPASPVTLTYTAPSGANAAYTVKYTSFVVRTNFGCSGVTDYNSARTLPMANLISEIDLPDGSKYTFTYETTPSDTHTPHDVTGRLTSVTLPTGGSINYAYTGGSSGHVTCADGSAATLTRTTPDGTWTYAQVKGTGAASTTTITAPQLPYDSAANQTVIQFQGIYETQRQVYQGAAGGTLLRSWNTCYNGAASPCTTTAITLPITQRSVIDQYGSAGLQCKHVYFYNSFGGLTEQDDYDYGSGAPGSLLRKTLIAFASLGNITAFKQTVTVQNGVICPLAPRTGSYDTKTF